MLTIQNKSQGIKESATNIINNIAVAKQTLLKCLYEWFIVSLLYKVCPSVKLYLLKNSVYLFVSFDSLSAKDNYCNR